MALIRNQGMTTPQFYTLIIAGVIASVLALSGLVMGEANVKLRADLNVNQAKLQEGAVSAQALTTLLQELAPLAMQDPDLAAMLARNGYTLESRPAPEQPK